MAMTLPQAQSRLSPLESVRARLLQGRKWRYLRYLHLRSAFALTREVGTVMSVGAGNALAELALALEHPEVQFLVTDVDSSKAPSRRLCETLARNWKVENLSFGAYDALQPSSLAADMVVSIEVLEHIEADATAAQNMNAAARRFVFCLVPFADRATNAHPARRRRAWLTHEHFRPGYDHETLAALFPNPVAIRGCYWADAGRPFRERLSALPDDEILSRRDELQAEAERDLRPGVPSLSVEASGIWILSAR